MKLEFLKTYWKDKLIEHSAAYITLANIELSEITRLILGKTGLPVIMPSEMRISFLPFTHLTEMEVKDKEFYVIGDFSPGLSGVALLAIEKKSECIYIIDKHKDIETSYNFVNQSLYQFLMCLAIFNIREEKIAQRIKENYITTGTELRSEYNAIVNEVSQIDEKAVLTEGFFWWYVLNNARWEVEAREHDEKIPYNENKKGFPQITGDDLPF